jgi:hydroxypyruvate isomerase
MNTFRQSFSWDGFIRAGSVTPEALVRAAAEIGYAGIDLVEEAHWHLIRDHGLEIVSITGHALSPEGLNRRENLPAIADDIRARLDLAVRWNIPYLLCFSGNRVPGVDEITAAEIAAENLLSLVEIVKGSGVTLLLELLNSKVQGRDYQADNSAWGVRVCQRVASPQVRLLYDIYHMQIMEGDIIATIRQQHGWFGHYHTAGVPGRHDLDDAQELNYPAILRAILETGYEGWIAHEFFPRGDPIAALKAAYDVCAIPPPSA